jgi:hypothetical protein
MVTAESPGAGGEILLVVVLVADVETVCEAEECEKDHFVIWKGECSRRWSACRCSDCDFFRDAEYSTESMLTSADTDIIRSLLLRAPSRILLATWGMLLLSL